MAECGLSLPFPMGFLRPGELAPAGWLLDRLELQARGLGGHIEELWPDLGPDSGWRGGRGEAWERGPYYLDGLVPLAQALGAAGSPEAPAIEAKARSWVEAILAGAGEGGSFGPAATRDHWPRTVALKALLSWHRGSGDERVLGLMLGACARQSRCLGEEPLHGWSRARAAENALAALELWEIAGDKRLLDLADACLEQALPWEEVFRHFPYRGKTGDYLPRALFLPYRWAVTAAQRLSGARMATARPRPVPPARAARERADRNYLTFHFTHNVDYAMAVKAPAVAAALRAARSAAGPEARDALRDAADLAEAGIESALRWHGLAPGIWSGDEHFSGREPTQGIELCGIVELMYSLETLVRLTGEARFADRLEILAFNALPAAFTEDMRGHQYLQQANQVEATRARRPWYDNGPEATVFGLMPEFGCCAANFHQAFPKLAQSLWFRAGDGGLACAVWAPARLAARAGGRTVRLELRTDYPGGEEAEIGVAVEGGGSAFFPLHLRVPSWCSGAVVVAGGEELPMGPPGSFFRLVREFRDGELLRVRLPLDLRTEDGPRGSVSVWRGPILFALPLAESWSTLRGEPPWDYREARSGEAWNFALALDPARPALHIEVERRAHPDFLFPSASPPLVLRARGKRLPAWRPRRRSAGPLPESPVAAEGPVEELALVPYACARLRIAQFPWTAPGGA